MKIIQVEYGKAVTYIFDNSLNKFTLTPAEKVILILAV